MVDLRNTETHPVNIRWLPSKGIPYPDTMEIMVEPMTIKERKLLDGATTSEYYRRLLDGVHIRGAQFRNRDLLFCDVQFLDLVRRIFTFELDKKLTVTKYPCYHCRTADVETSFSISDLEFESIKEDLFGVVKSYTDNETGEIIETKLPGKPYKFSDGTEVIVTLPTVGDFIEAAARYMTNAVDDENIQNKQNTDAYIGGFTYLVKQVTGKDFKSDADRRKFLFEYIGGLYKNSDSKVLEQIIGDTQCEIKPLKAVCPNCEKEVEVYVQPSLTFRQDD